MRKDLIVLFFIIFAFGMVKLTKAKRSKIMSSIHSRDTKPEMIVRKFLWSHGFRYRLNVKRLPGHPDIVLRKYRTCIFVNGCFWHGHDCEEFRPPRSNKKYWMEKIRRNKERDSEEQRQLADMGWHCVTVWECELKKDKREKTLESLAYTLNHIYLLDHSLCYGHLDQENEESSLAAEPCPFSKD